MADPDDATTVIRPSELVSRRAGWAAIAYFGLYLAYLFWRLESEALHWLTLVTVPLVIALISSPAPGRLRFALASVGLRQRGLLRGIGWALILGGGITAFQILGGRHGPALQELIADGRALLLFPAALLLMIATAGFTEELFFRGFLQTRVERLLGSPWGTVPVTALAFALYHLPYALLHPAWPTHGDLSAAWLAAMTEGGIGGLMLGALYAHSRGNLMACVLLHALVNAGPAMTMIRFGP